MRECGLGLKVCGLGWVRVLVPLGAAFHRPGSVAGDEGVRRVGFAHAVLQARERQHGQGEGGEEEKEGEEPGEVDGGEEGRGNGGGVWRLVCG